MRNLSAAVAAALMGIALYFALTWGFTALQSLASPSYGLDDMWHSQFIFALGHYFGLTPVGILKLAAFIAAVKLVAAGICAVHVIDRMRGAPRLELLEGALMLIAAIAFVAIAPAAWSRGGDILGEHVLHLGFALFALALCAAERKLDRNAEDEILAQAEAHLEGAYTP
jgi:hypothetical protein